MVQSKSCVTFEIHEMTLGVAHPRGTAHARY